MKYFLKLLLITLLLCTTLFAEVFHKPDYDPRLSIDQRALEWWNHAGTDSASAFNIGLLYQKRIHDNKLAELWYKQALNVDDKNIDALINLGAIYEDIKKYNQAIKYYQLADKNHDLRGAFNLAIFYNNQNNYRKAEYWYQKAIKKENLKAIKNLGRLYHYKLKDDIKAAEYFIALINNGYSKDRIISYLKTKWKLSNETIKQGYEAQLKSKVIPEKLKYKGGI
jgi:uncharacterized protein